jgi:hypothetical protein
MLNSEKSEEDLHVGTQAHEYVLTEAGAEYTHATRPISEDLSNDGISMGVIVPGFPSIHKIYWALMQGGSIPLPPTQPLRLVDKQFLELCLYIVFFIQRCIVNMFRNFQKFLGLPLLSCT